MAILSVYQTRFLETALAVEALKFGEFTLKSGRKSPYFFNIGAFCDGRSLAVLARAYAEVIAALIREGRAIDGLFGPAYKGIVLVAAIAGVLWEHHGVNLSWTSNRKEIKEHGEGGMLIGGAVTGRRVVIVDDVLTAGTAVRRSLSLLREAGAFPVGLIVALDRQESLGKARRSVLMQIEREVGIFTRALVCIDDVLSFIGGDTKNAEHLADMRAYRAKYGV